MTIDWQSIRTDIQARMDNAGLSQSALAAKAHVDQGNLSKFLAGKRQTATLDLLDALGPVLGIDFFGGDSDLVGRVHDQLTEQLRNPRHDADPDALRELAASIEQQGVLQNLVIGPLNGIGTHPVWAGNRRLAAVKLLATEDRTIAGVPAAAYRIPCRVVDGDPVAVMTVAMIENLQREDMRPMDEAEAFAWLRDEGGLSTAEIAAKISRTQRFVQRRLALVDKLDDSVKDALRQGEITFVKAEAIAVVDKDEQADALEDAKSDFWTADELREHLLGDKYPVSTARFDLDLYEGDYHDVGDERYFADSLQFIRLQREAAQQMAISYPDWKWSKLHDYHKHGWFYDGNYARSEDKKKAGVVVFIGMHYEIKVYEGLVEPATAKKPSTVNGGAGTGPADAGGANIGKPKKHFTDAHLRLARQMKTAVLQDAVLADPAAALRLCVMGLLGLPEVRVQIGQGDSQGNARCGEATIAASRKAFEALGGTIREHEETIYAARPRLQRAVLKVGGYGMRDDLDPIAVWTRLNEMPDADVLQLLAVIVAGQTGTWNDYQAALGDSAFAARLAADLDVSMVATAQAALRDDDYLKSAGKAHVAEIATDLGNQPKASDTAKTIRGWIADSLAVAMSDYIPRELRWGKAAMKQDEN